MRAIKVIVGVLAAGLLVGAVLIAPDVWESRGAYSRVGGWEQVQPLKPGIAVCVITPAGSFECGVMTKTTTIDPRIERGDLVRLTLRGHGGPVPPAIRAVKLGARAPIGFPGTLTQKKADEVCVHPGAPAGSDSCFSIDENSQVNAQLERDDCVFLKYVMKSRVVVSVQPRPLRQGSCVYEP